MASDIRSLVDDFISTGGDITVASNPLSQFGPPDDPFVGAQLLPEKTVPGNTVKEEYIRYRSLVANNGTRYSPVQKKKGALFGKFSAELAESDIGSELNGPDYDGLLRILNSNASMQGLAQITQWADTTVNSPLLQRNEVMRWEALEKAAVALVGDNAYGEVITYSDPAGHRAVAGGTWSSNTYDPFTDIFAMRNLARSKGLRLKRIFASTSVTSIMGNNAKVQGRTGRAVINVGGSGVAVATGAATLQQINQALSADGIPAIENYDKTYNTDDGSFRYMSDNVMVFICDSGRDPALDLGETAVLAPEILSRINGFIGYTAVGRAAGQNFSGRVLQVEAFKDKPPRVWGSGWQTSLPVVVVPEGVLVIKSIA